MLNEFKSFVLRGNVVDLAVAVVIGGAFGAIVNSVVNDIFMPIIGIIIGGINFSGLTVSFGEATIKYGNFLQMLVNFLIIAAAMFLTIQALNRLKKAEAPAAPVVPEIPKQEQLLAEIRDLLKNR